MSDVRFLRCKLVWTCLAGAVCALFDPQAVLQVFIDSRKAEDDRQHKAAIERRIGLGRKVRVEFDMIGKTRGYPYNDKFAVPVADVDLLPEHLDLPPDTPVYIRRLVNL
jgi:hypothetical protein